MKIVVLVSFLSDEKRLLLYIWSALFRKQNLKSEVMESVLKLRLVKDLNINNFYNVSV